MKRADYAYHPKMVGDDLKSIRLHFGYSFGDFARILGVSERMYRYYEDGKSSIPKAIGMVAEGMVSDGYNIQGTLTSYDDHRIRVLNDAMYQYAETVDLDEAVTRKILKQASKEIDLLLSKFES